MPSLQAGSDSAARVCDIQQLKDFGKNFAIASPLASDLIPLLACGVREQTELTETAAPKALQPVAKQPLPRISAPSSKNNPLTASPAIATRNLRMGVADDTAGNKTFEMQTREVDAVKAVTPLVAQPKFSNGPNGNSNSENLDVGKPSGDQPHKTKRKSFKNNKQPDAKMNNATDQTDASSAALHKVSFEHQQASRGGVDADAGPGAISGRKYPNKWRNDNSEWNNNQGKLHAGSNGRPNFNNNKPRGGGFVRPHRSNTYDDDRTPRHNRYHNNGGFRSVRGDPRGQFDEQMVPKANPKQVPAGRNKVNSTANDGSATYQTHSYAQPMYDTFGAHSPSTGVWRPHSQQLYGPPPPMFMQPQGKLPAQPPSATGVLVPMPFAQSHQGPMLPLSQEPSLSQPAGMRHGNARPSVVGADEPAAQSAPAITSADANLAQRSKEAHQVTTLKIDSPLSNSSTAAALYVCDPRPAQMRIEGLMTTIVGELQHLKLRIMPGVEHKLSVSDMARYLDTCMDLCKLAIGASAELSNENVALLNRVGGVPGMVSAPTSALASPTGMADTVMKLGGNQHAPQQDLPTEFVMKPATGSDVKFNQRKEHDSYAAAHTLPTYTLPSGAQTHFVPPIPTYAGYCIDRKPNDQPNGNANMENMTGGQPWWVQKKQHEFLESERERLRLSFEGKEAAKEAAKGGANEGGNEVAKGNW